MRKIEQQMLSAIESGNSWMGGNTYVNPCVGFIEVQLHGNVIARIDNVYGTIEVDINTVKQWPTNTTLSRLRALGVNICKRKGVVLLNGEEI